MVLGAIGPGLAMACVRGGRDVANLILSGAYQAGQQRLPQSRAEMAQAKDQAARDAETIKQQVQPSSGASTNPAVQAE